MQNNLQLPFSNDNKSTEITYQKLEDGGEYLVESICVVIFYLFLENH